MTDNTKLDLILQKISALDERVGNMDERLSGLDEKVSGIDKRLSGLDEKVSGIDKRLNGLDEKVSGIDKRLNGLDEKVSGIDKRLNGLDEKVSGIDERVSSVEEELKEVKKQSIKTNLILENEIRVNIQRVAEGHLDLSRNLHEAMKPNNEVEMLAIRVSMLESDVMELKSKIS